MKAYFESNRRKLRFPKKKTYSGNMLWTAGSILEKGRDSFESMPAKEVRLDLSRPIEIGQLGLDREPARRDAIAGDAKLIGERVNGPRDHGKANWKHGDEEEEVNDKYVGNEFR